jgi:hypothetical protein
MQNLDVVPLESCLEERLDRGLGVARIRNGPHHAIGRIGNEVSTFSRAGFHDSSPGTLRHG